MAVDGHAMRRGAPGVLALLLPVLLLAGCFGVVRDLPDGVTPPAHVTRGPAELVLVTVMLNGTGRHSALIIDDGTRVLYDPAGGWRDPDGLTDRDLRLAMTDARLRAYLSYHTRRGREVVLQRKPVPPATARAARRIAESRGAEVSGLCTVAVATLLQPLPGFNSLRVPVAPVALMEAFAGLDGVATQVFRPPGVLLPARIAAGG